MKFSVHPLHRDISSLVKSDEAVVVGGAVRDRLLGREIVDLDIALPEDPQTFAETLAKKRDGRCFPLDEERRIYRVSFADGIYVDLAKWQGDTIEKDLDRRDFTINALAVPLKKWRSNNWKSNVIDRNNGLTHLRQNQIVPVSKTVFSDDPLRLLRAFRIAAELNFFVGKPTLSLIHKEKNKIKRSAPERIREEWLRLFAAADSYSVLENMNRSGLLDVLFPESKNLRRTAPRYYGKGGVLKHTLDSVQCFEDIHKTLRSWFPASAKEIQLYLNEKISGHVRHAHCKWALMLHDIGKPKTAAIVKGRLRFFEHEHVGADMVQKLALRYRWSSDETVRYARLVRNHMRPGNLAAQDVLTDKAIHRFFRDLGDDAVAMLLVSLADHLTYLTPTQKKKRATSHEKITIKMIHRYYQESERVAPPRLVNGNDVMKHLKIPPSPMIGTLLKELQEAQSEGHIKTKEAALEFLKKAHVQMVRT